MLPEEFRLEKQASRVREFFTLLDRVNVDRAKQASWLGGKPATQPKKGIVERMILFPFRHPKLTMFTGGVGAGYWLANKKNTTTNNNYYPAEQYQDYGAGYQ